MGSKDPFPTKRVMGLMGVKVTRILIHIMVGLLEPHIRGVFTSYLQQLGILNLGK